jgi:hypothetical protein
MTTTDRVALTATVERLGAELIQARQDVALMQRLKNAEADAKRLAVELRTAQEELVQVNTAEVQAHRAAAYASYKDITVSGGAADASVLDTTFVITVTSLTYNGWETVPEILTYSGFRTLPREAVGYLLEVHPEQIPAKIKALAPGDNYEAFDRYFTALRRGYLTTAAA